MTLENEVNILCCLYTKCFLLSAVPLIELSNNWISSAVLSVLEGYCWGGR